MKREQTPKVITGDAPTLPDGFSERLKVEREGFHLRWRAKAKMVRPGSYNADGTLAALPAYEPRWELWDYDIQGREYCVMRLQNPDGSFRPPGDWLLETLRKLNPANYIGGVAGMLKELSEKPDILREAGTKKDSDDLIHQAGSWAAWAATPKSYANQLYRGPKELSGAGGMR